MSIGNRIRLMRRQLKLSQPDLAKRAGVGQSTISDLENDKKNTSAKNMESIAKVLGTSTTYLINGGENQQIDPNNGDFNSKNSHLLDFGIIPNDLVEIEYLDDITDFNKSEDFRSTNMGAKKITVNRQALESRGITPDKCKAYSVIDNSMSPTIKNGDIIYVDQGRSNIRDGKIFAILHGDLFKFKRLYKLPFGGIRVVSDNAEEFPEEKLTAEEIIDQQFQVIGWAWSWQSMENW